MERSGKMTIEEVLAVEEMQVFDRKSVNIAPKVLAIPIIAFLFTHVNSFLCKSDFSYT